MDTRKACCCSLLVLGLIILVCGGTIKVESVRKQAKIMKAQAFLKTNGSVKVLGIYTVYNAKGHSIGQSAVLEGMKTKERWTAAVEPKLPVINEIWKCAVTEDGRLILSEVVVAE